MSAITEFDGVVGEIKELVDGIYDNIYILEDKFEELFEVAKEQGASKEVFEIINKCSNVVYDFQMNSDFSKVDDELEHANELMEY